MERESKFLEYKSGMTNTFLKTVCAYSNYGKGEIIFGVSDDGNITGISDTNNFCLDIENKINDSISPLPEYTIRINNDSTVSLIVFEGEFKPYLYKGKTYCRNDSATVECSRLETQRLILQGKNQTFEEQGASTQDLTFDKLNSALQNALELENAGLDILKTLDLYSGKKGYNNAAALLSDKNDYLLLDLAKFRDDIDEIQDRRRIEKVSILEAYEKAIDFFRQYYEYEKIEGSKRITVELLPEKAFREAIANALIHRTWDVNSAILVRMFNDKIEIISPGGLPPGLSESEYLEGRISSLRNPILANVFFRLNIIEMMGTGIRRIKAAYKSLSVSPGFSVTENSISVVLPVLDFQNLSEDEKKVLALLKKSAMTRNEIENILGMNKSKVIRLLNKLEEKSLIKRTGQSRDVKYMV